MNLMMLLKRNDQFLEGRVMKDVTKVEKIPDNGIRITFDYLNHEKKITSGSTAWPAEQIYKIEIIP